jgi:hypothetical protein
VAGQRDDSDSTLIRVRRLLARPAASSCLRWQWASVQHRLGVSGVRLLDGHVEAGPFGYGVFLMGTGATTAGCAKV